MVKVVGIILALIPTLLGIYFAWGAYQGVAAFRPISLSPQVDATLAVACYRNSKLANDGAIYSL